MDIKVISSRTAFVLSQNNKTTLHIHVLCGVGGNLLRTGVLPTSEGRRLWVCAGAMMWRVGAVGLVAMAAVIGWTPTVYTLSGPNVCNKLETYTSLRNLTYTKAHSVLTYEFCLSIPPKCEKYKIMYKTGFKTQSQTKTRTVEVCCSGYSRDPHEEDRCIPICSQDCIHGVCFKPDECQCEAGYSGPNCNINTGTIERWSLAHRIAGVRFYYETKSIIQTQRRLRQLFNISSHDPIPSSNAILAWVHKFEYIGCVTDIPHGPSKIYRIQGLSIGPVVEVP